MTLLQGSQNSWQNKMGKKDVIAKPVRISRLSVHILFVLKNNSKLNMSSNLLCLPYVLCSFYEDDCFSILIPMISKFAFQSNYS